MIIIDYIKNKLHYIFNFKSLFLLLMCAFVSAGQALVLEDLIQSKMLKSALQGKKIGYYLGSFDPLHKGHEVVAELPITLGLCDYVLIYPSWGGDSWKSRADVSARLEMLFAAFQHHPKIIVTYLKPKDLQNVLTVSDSSTKIKNLTVKPAFTGTEFIGLIGSDTALSLANNEKAASGFMTGIKIPPQYETHTLGGCMAIPVNSFIVAMRANDDLSSLHGKIRSRSILAIIESNNEQTMSSTKAKKELKSGSKVNTMLSSSTVEIISKYNLYSEH